MSGLTQSNTLRSGNPKEYGIAYSQELIGARSVEALSDLYAIPVNLLSAEDRLNLPSNTNSSKGGLWYVENDDAFYYLKDIQKHDVKDGWKKFQSSAGMPILTQAAVDELEQQNDLPDEYIKISDTPDAVETANRGYIDIMFSAIRKLQAEVAKLRNTMNFGLNSYTGVNTAYSATQQEYYDTDAEEPLWAIEESDLSELDGAICPISKDHKLINSTVKEAVTINQVGDTENQYLTINSNGAYFTDNDPMLGFKAAEDAKLLLYLTTSNMNFKVDISETYDDEPDSDEYSSKYTIDFSKFNVQKSQSETYNTMVVVSRKTLNETDGKYYGSNFIWISITDTAALIQQKQGYVNIEDIDNPKIQDAPYEISVEDGHRLYMSRVWFNDINLYKLNAYTKYQNFTTEVEPSLPDDSEYKYKVAHITIRSVESEEVLESIIKQLQKNELIYIENDKSLCIVNEAGSYVKLGSTSNNNNNDNTEDDGMTQAQIIEWLESNGIHVTDTGDKNLTMDNIADITFMHEGTQKKFKFSCTADGELKSFEIPDTALADRVSKLADLSGMYKTDQYEDIAIQNLNAEDYIRGFVGKLGYNEFKQNSSINELKDIGLYADRVKIGQIYAPKPDQKTYGCSHAFIELENTSDKDFQLDGCYIHMAVLSGNTVVEHDLALDGRIPAGGTYLIRGKQYTGFDQANCFIKVETFDKEWYVPNEDGEYDGTLADFTIGSQNTYMLTYGLPGKDSDPESTFNYQKAMIKSAEYDTAHQANIAKSPYLYNPRYIDSIAIVKPIIYNTQTTWNPVEIDVKDIYKTSCISFGALSGESGGIYKDCIYRNTFELDPAKQAFQGLTMNDSSRCRGTNAQDFQYLFLDKDIIEFPKTDMTTPVEYFTPKASFEKKNVSTDKTKLDGEKPNMVTCSFGRNIHKTRCFNWISKGLFDEYIWIRKSTDTAWARFESYKDGTESDYDAGTTITKRGFTETFIDKTTNSERTIKSLIYNRISSTFPGCGVEYTAHKCVLDMMTTDDAAQLEEPVTYQYRVGRADKNMNPDEQHASEIYTFTVYPETYIPKVYQVTDQQGFHWIEYQVWAAAASKLNEEIEEDAAKSHIIPILINTGDMTQNGTRVNEWLDYYNAGKKLFSHLEQMNVVGNNDLCGVDPTKLGTGDDAGKSNPFYFHVFYCYEVDTDNLPIISNANATTYVPSLYYFENICKSEDGTADESQSYRFLMLNSEITKTTCTSIFQQKTTDGVVNVYTGFPITNSTAGKDKPSMFDDTFTSIYEMIYNMINGYSNPKNIIAVCHEMPFTVITGANLADGKSDVDRSLDKSSTGSLVGSHMNKISNDDTISNYWFSRLLEYFGVKLCIGGHKHTYMCTWPIREFYYYNDADGNLSCSYYGKMPMEKNLSGDTADFTYDVGKDSSNVCISAVTDANGKITMYSFEHNSENTYTTKNSDGTTIRTFNTSKYPFVQINSDAGVDIKEGIRPSGSYMLPYYGINEETNGVVYFMLQATGYKLKSNKELPSTYQKFAYIIPKTGSDTYGDKPSNDQLYPMFAKINLNENNYSVQLIRIENITGTKGAFSQLDVAQNTNAKSSSPVCKYFYKQTSDETSDTTNIIYGKWTNEEKTLVTVSK